MSATPTPATAGTPTSASASASASATATPTDAKSTNEDDPSMTRIYVTNLNFETTDEQLEKWFREKLENKSKVSSNIVTFRRGTTIRSRGYAFVCVENQYHEKAIALDGQVLMDRPLTIKLANTRRTDDEKQAAKEEREKKREEARAKRTATTTTETKPKRSQPSKSHSSTDVRIRINNVNYDATQEQLQEFVEKALGGKPVECSIVAYTRAGESRSRGYAHLTVTQSQVDAALAMDGTIFLEREIRVRRSVERSQQSSHQGQEQKTAPTPAPTSSTSTRPKGKKRQEGEPKQPTPTPAPATKSKKQPQEQKEQKQPPPERKRRERPEITDFKAENAEIGIHSDYPLIDIGANLIDRRYRDFDTVVKRAHAAGVTRIILTGTNLETTKVAIELVKKYPGQIYTTVGIHPHNAKKCTDEMLTEMETIAKSGNIVAIGECGLDFNRDYSPRDVQIKVFEQQVALAVKLKLPLFLHEREAHTELLSILSKYKDLPPVVIHCFTGSQSELQAYIKAGYSIGLTGFIAMKGRGEEIRKILKEIPLKQLMIETDSPYMSPNGDSRVKRFRNRNEPVTLPIVVETIHKNTNYTLKEVAEATTANAVAFFNLK